VNWKLIFLLSMFGLAMGIATVFVIPSNVEPLFWAVIFVMCAYVIASRCSRRYFLHGLFVSLANSVWITAAHIAFFDQYITNHRREAAMMTSMPLPNSPRTMMALMGPCVGLASGVILGLLSVAAHKIMVSRAKKR
jgi:hypothetical protein